MLFVFLQPESTNSPDNNLVSGPVISELIDQDYIPDTKQAGIIYYVTNSFSLNI